VFRARQDDTTKSLSDISQTVTKQKRTAYMKVVVKALAHLDIGHLVTVPQSVGGLFGSR
jgi:hypothetical protein